MRINGAMKYWPLTSPPVWIGWRRSVSEDQRVLGRMLDRDEAELIRNYKPKIRRIDD